VIIGFLGTVFSPRYYRARRLGATDPYDHCALNVALYGENLDRWVFTEYDRTRTQCSDDTLRLGHNRLEYTDDSLICHIDDLTAPLPSRVRGTVRLDCTRGGGPPVRLLPGREHLWRVIVPCGEVHVDLQQPRLTWRGQGYFDSNNGDEPLEVAFQHWSWLRATTAARRTLVVYHLSPSCGAEVTHALEFDPQGSCSVFDAPPAVSLRKSSWGIPRQVATEDPARAQLRSVLENAPFYVRSVVDTQLCGETVTAIHECASLERFQSPWVRSLLPFRMRRSLR
jgi:carotenoid 1,2-hydratase